MPEARRSIEYLAHATPVEARDYWTLFEAELAQDDGAAAREHLAAGRPISYREPTTPPGHVIRRYPDGRRELVRIDWDGDTVVGPLPPG